jgi:hypothetical protein
MMFLICICAIVTWFTLLMKHYCLMFVQRLAGRLLRHPGANYSYVQGCQGIQGYAKGIAGGFDQGTSKGANPRTRSMYEKNYLRYSVFFSGIPEINNSAIFSTYELCDRIFENVTS